MNNHSYKNLINLLVVALLVSLASIIFISNQYLNLVDKQTVYIMNSQSQNVIPVTEPQLAISLSSTPDWQKYQNDKYGIQIQFPETWQGYSVVTSDSSDNFSVSFSFKDPYQPFTLFQIIRYTKDQWTTLNKNSMTKLITQSDGSVLACDGCCSIDSDFTGAGQFDQFQIARCKEVPSILQSLKVVK